MSQIVNTPPSFLEEETGVCFSLGELLFPPELDLSGAGRIKGELRTVFCEREGEDAVLAEVGFALGFPDGLLFLGCEGSGDGDVRVFEHDLMNVLDFIDHGIVCGDLELRGFCGVCSVRSGAASDELGVCKGEFDHGAVDGLFGNPGSFKRRGGAAGAKEGET